jgi:UPF0755 protein
MLKMANRARTTKPTRRKAILWIALTVIVVMMIVGAFGLRQWLFQRWPVTPPGVQRVLIPAGSSLPQVAAQLEQAGVIGDAERFVRMARWREAAQKIKAGEYEFAKAATPGEILDRLIAGDVLKVRITIPEGFTLRQIAARVAEAGLASAEQFRRLATDPARARKFGIDAATLEGYLFPETYIVTSTTTAEELLRAMVYQFERQLKPGLLAAARARGLNRHQLVTLASIVQKEAGSEEEMPLIAGVFHNRLRKGMRLQADPTVIYGIRDFNGNLTRRDLTTPTPYNTYTRGGLPPGPIASPGLAALRAAAEPAVTPALYFVANGNGRHQFNATLEAHNRAVNRYQRGGR